jgi:hypothetical protein
MPNPFVGIYRPPKKRDWESGIRTPWYLSILLIVGSPRASFAARPASVNSLMSMFARVCIDIRWAAWDLVWSSKLMDKWPAAASTSAGELRAENKGS